MVACRGLGHCCRLASGRLRQFSDLSQEGWGHQVPSGIFDATTAYSLYFQVNGPANAAAAPVTADFWVDDVYFE